LIDKLEQQSKYGEKDWKHSRGEGTIFFYMNHFIAKLLDMKENGKKRKTKNKVDVKKSMNTVISNTRVVKNNNPTFFFLIIFTHLILLLSSSSHFWKRKITK
jgi:hypothetical protein